MSRIGFEKFLSTTLAERERVIRESYLDGYRSGFDCPDEWEPGYKQYGGPGGPWVYGDRIRHPEYTEQSYRENEAWRRGWKAGNAEKHARRADLARGWDDRGGIGESML